MSQSTTGRVVGRFLSPISFHSSPLC
jgi:hypothetical protein